MFTSPLPDNEDYRVLFSEYAESHYIKKFAKNYKGKRWALTQESIFQELKRIHALQNTQQVDQLKSGDGCLLFKYDFAVAQTNVSPKASGNRCIVFLDIEKHEQMVLYVYGKGDLPKSPGETQHILHTVKSEFKDLWDRLN